jgi:hypothetical protein
LRQHIIIGKSYLLGGLMVSVLAIGLKVFRLKPGRGDGVFRVKKKPQNAFL